MKATSYLIKQALNPVRRLQVFAGGEQPLFHMSHNHATGLEGIVKTPLALRREGKLSTVEMGGRKVPKPISSEMYEKLHPRNAGADDYFDNLKQTYIESGNPFPTISLSDKPLSPYGPSGVITKPSKIEAGTVSPKGVKDYGQLYPELGRRGKVHEFTVTPHPKAALNAEVLPQAAGVGTYNPRALIASAGKEEGVALARQFKAKGAVPITGRLLRYLKLRGKVPV